MSSINNLLALESRSLLLSGNLKTSSRSLFVRNLVATSVCWLTKNRWRNYCQNDDAVALTVVTVTVAVFSKVGGNCQRTRGPVRFICRQISADDCSRSDMYHTTINILTLRCEVTGLLLSQTDNKWHKCAVTQARFSVCVQKGWLLFTAGRAREAPGSPLSQELRPPLITSQRHLISPLTSDAYGFLCR